VVVVVNKNPHKFGYWVPPNTFIGDEVFVPWVACECNGVVGFKKSLLFTFLCVEDCVYVLIATVVIII